VFSIRRLGYVMGISMLLVVPLLTLHLLLAISIPQVFRDSLGSYLRRQGK
jgi:hypothetical protein